MAWYDDLRNAIERGEIDATNFVFATAGATWQIGKNIGDTLYNNGKNWYRDGEHWVVEDVWDKWKNQAAQQTAEQEGHDSVGDAMPV